MTNDTVWYSAIFVIIFSMLALAFWPTDVTHLTVKYDCRIAEISPDYPVAVKEACRKRSLK